ncbi:MAG: type II secretion system protein M [Betaproteobacteria bacterium]|nr:type II secretion system protein M [Betaproteobacteria bacterium]MDE2003985.1 type II secretion system protein M [Betaproteobacteria bacterium]MDE2208108.1 type II secretion system protein M [Betaproteobacteria bacterium]MDE2358113.1 type II secretion system protein M [Betaproteobacteria bacterium]
MMPATLAPLIDAWNRAGARARVATAAIVVVALTAVILLWIVVPLQDAVGRARADLARERMNLATARSELAEDASLAHAIAPARAGDAAAAVDRVLAAHGLVPLSRAHADDGRIDVVIPDARFDALVRALDVLLHDEGVRVVEATLLARVAPGSVRAELALTRSGPAR